MSQEWFYSKDGQGRIGPVTATELQSLAKSGQLMATDMVWNQGMTQWASASTIKGLFANVEPTLKPSPTPPRVPVQDDEDRAPKRKPRYEEGEDDDRSDSRRPGPRESTPGQSPSATEYAVSSVILSGAVLISELYPMLAVIGAAMSEEAGAMVGATLIILLLLGLSILAVVFAIRGLLKAVGEQTAGKIFCITGLCVAGLPVIINLMLLLASASTTHHSKGFR